MQELHVTCHSIEKIEILKPEKILKNSRPCLCGCFILSVVLSFKLRHRG